MVSIKRHGLSIGIERIDNQFFISLKAQGKLTHQDYEKITPMIDSALSGVEDPEVKVFIDGTLLEGWEPRAAWDDFKLGLKHGREFVQIAIYGNKKWQKAASRIAGWFTAGESCFFEDEREALDWLLK
jgi:hypothetical protein